MRLRAINRVPSSRRGHVAGALAGPCDPPPDLGGDGSRAGSRSVSTSELPTNPHWVLAEIPKRTRWPDRAIRLLTSAATAHRPVRTSAGMAGLLPTGGGAPARRARRGFTLVEVILAVVIATGLLVVVLFFYQQSANLRTQLIQESERIASVRLLMDRLTAELRTASALSSSRIAFAGDASSIRFITVGLPVRSAWSAGPAGRLVTPQTDLRLVSYSLARSIEGSNVVTAGLVRTEQSTVEVRSRATPARTNEVAAERRPAPAPNSPRPEPVSDAIRYVRFRYWGGEDWKESWSEVELPRAVEISLAGEPPPERTAEEAAEFPPDLYRRVVYLPGSEAGAGLSAISVLMDENLPGEEMP